MRKRQISHNCWLFKVWAVVRKAPCARIEPNVFPTRYSARDWKLTDEVVRPATLIVNMKGKG